MANTRKTASKKSDSVKYTNMFAAWGAFWRRGFTEWAGTSSRSEYWWSTLCNLLVIVPLSLIVISGAASAFTQYNMYDTLAFSTDTMILSGTAMFVLIAFALAISIPSISLFVRRMHDVGLSAWWLLLWFLNFVWIGEIIWFVFSFVVCILPTKTTGNPYHKNNK